MIPNPCRDCGYRLMFLPSEGLKFVTIQDCFIHSIFIQPLCDTSFNPYQSSGGGVSLSLSQLSAGKRAMQINFHSAENTCFNSLLQKRNAEVEVMSK